MIANATKMLNGRVVSRQQLKAMLAELNEIKETKREYEKLLNSTMEVSATRMDILMDMMQKLLEGVE